ncbi:hypothetical protein PMG11_09608 [Penicillium brasilianum]|uniref:Uncharacterized protein n=1 Tax=Penicillium brasilianum TaxID=104259 RepID=A0A0F7TWL2_PENBI|nr:hypothetical protein PMG11_09608 [Penicillium brasilianum]
MVLRDKWSKALFTHELENSAQADQVPLKSFSFVAQESEPLLGYDRQPASGGIGSTLGGWRIGPSCF